MAQVLKFSDCACFNIRKTARVLAQAYDRALEPSGLKNTQFTALALVAGRDPMSITELSRIMEIERTTLTRNLNILVRDGLVRIQPGADARSKRIEATAKGKATLKKAIPLWQSAQTQLLQLFGKKRWSLLRRELRAISNFSQAR